MGDEVLLYPPPLAFFSFVYDPAFIYLCIISHHFNASESNFEENLRYPGHFDSPKVFKRSKFIPSYICNKCWGVGQYGVITMMISLAAIWLVRHFWMIDMSELWIPGHLLVKYEFGHGVVDIGSKDDDESMNRVFVTHIHSISVLHTVKLAMSLCAYFASLLNTSCTKSPSCLAI